MRSNLSPAIPFIKRLPNEKFTDDIGPILASSSNDKGIKDVARFGQVDHHTHFLMNIVINSDPKLSFRTAELSIKKASTRSNDEFEEVFRSNLNKRRYMQLDLQALSLRKQRIAMKVLQERINASSDKKDNFPEVLKINFINDNFTSFDHLAIPPRAISALLASAYEKDIDIKIDEATAEGLAASNETESGALKMLLRDSHEKVPGKIVNRNKNATAEVLDLISKTEDKRVLAEIAGHKNVSPSLLEKLAKRADATISENVAGNPNTPLAILKDYLREDSALGRIAASNKGLPPDLIDALARGATGQKLGNFIRNPAILPDTIDKLFAENPTVETTRAMAESMKTSQKILDELACSDDWQTANHIAMNENTSPETLRWLFKNGRGVTPLNAIRNPNADPAWLDSLARLNGTKYHVDIGISKATSPATLHYIATEIKYPDAQWHVARNSKTSTDTRDWLAKHAADDVRVEIANSSKTSPKTLAELADRFFRSMNFWTNSSLSGETVHYVVENGDAWCWQNIANHPNILEESLRLMAKTTNKAAQAAIARNPKTSDDIVDTFR